MEIEHIDARQDQEGNEKMQKTKKILCCMSVVGATASLVGIGSQKTTNTVGKL